LTLINVALVGNMVVVKIWSQSWQLD